MDVTGTCIVCKTDIYEDTCLHLKYKVTIPEQDRIEFFEFMQEVQANYAAQVHPNTEELFIPPSKYPKHPLVIPSRHENPCVHCKIGEETIGPLGCGRVDVCLAYMYVMFNTLEERTKGSHIEMFRQFKTSQIKKKKQRKKKSPLTVLKT